MALDAPQPDRMSDSRRRLLNSVTNLFLLDRDPSDTSKEHFGEIAVSMLAQLADDHRKDFAEQIAAVPTLPNKVAVALGGDANAEVARAVLALSPVLTDDDLAAFAESLSQIHLVAIAERAQVPSRITDILVERGEEAVLRQISANDGAVLSGSSFDHLLTRGSQDSVLAEALARRSDLCRERLERVLKVVGEVAKRRVAKGPSMLANRAHERRLEIDLLLTELEARKRELDDVLIMLASEERAFNLAQVLGRAASISVEQALRALLQRDATALAMACRSLDVDGAAFAALVQFRSRRLRKSARPPEQDVAAYPNVPMAAAVQTMEALRARNGAR